MPEKPAAPPRISNKKAKFNFELLESMEAGIVLTGSEVKSLRAGHASLDESYATIKGNELLLIDCNISPYERAPAYAQHKPKRERKLLMHRAEIRKLLAKVTQQGFTLVPLAMFFNDRGLVKVSIALAKGKTFGDKRQDLKARDAKREMDRAMRRR